MGANRNRAVLAEASVLEYEFPVSMQSGFAWAHPGLPWEPVETGVRDWFVCCAYAEEQLGLPSRVVDWCWRALVDDDGEYTAFCEEVFNGGPEKIAAAVITAELGEANLATVRAWGHSKLSARRDSVLWDLDERVGIADPLGLGPEALDLARRPLDLDDGSDWVNNPARLWGT